MRELGILRPVYIKSADPLVGLQLTEGRLSLATRDGALELRTQVDVQTAGEGGLAVRSNRLFELVKDAPEALVTLAERDGVLELSSGTFAARLPMGTWQELPALDDTATSLTVPVERLARMLERVSSAVPAEGGALVAGILLEQRDGVLRAVATNGHRLSLASSESANAETTLILPRRAAAQCATLLFGLSGDAVLRHTSDMCEVVAGQRYLRTPLVAAKFPPYARILPDALDWQVTVSRSELMDAVRMIQAATESDGVTLNLTPSATTVSAGDSTVSLRHAVTTTTGAIAVGLTYLWQVLTQCPTTEVSIGGDQTFRRPVVVEPLGQDSGVLAKHLIAPMTL